MANTTVTFGYTGGAQIFTVPANVFSITIEQWGGYCTYFDSGGALKYSGGGHILGALTVVPGDVYYIYVGGNTSFNSNPQLAGPPGYNAGGAGSSASGSSSAGYGDGGLGGAGRTDIRGPNANAKANIKACAGGSGGYAIFASSNEAGLPGGVGGATTGGDGGAIATGGGGKGGTQSAGGAGGAVAGTTYTAGAAGPASGAGGAAAQFSTVSGSGSVIHGSGGGGGGWFGGGGGAARKTATDGIQHGGNAGGGGSNYTTGLTSTTTNAAGTISGTAPTAPQCQITYLASASSPPNTPTSCSPSNGQATNSTGTLALSMVYSDPNANGGHGVFRYTTDPSFATYTQVVLSTVASGAASTGSVSGLSLNTQYYFRFYSFNTTLGLYSTNYYGGFFWTDRPSDVPTLETPTAGYASLANTSVAASAQVSDPDGVSCYAVFEVSTSNTFGTFTSFNGSNVNSGQISVASITGLTQGTHYYIRAATHGTTTGAYGAPNDFYTNRSPNTPVAVQPANNIGVDYTTPISFSWTFTDPDSNDYQSSADIQYKISGAGAFTLLSGIATVATSWTAPANTFAGGAYEYQIRTYDSAGNVSPWSASAFFTSASAPTAPTITAPTAASTQTVTPMTVTWTTGAAQIVYQIQITGDTSGAFDPGKLFYDTGSVSSSSLTASVPLSPSYPIQWVRVRYQQYAGIWSAWTNLTFNVILAAPQPVPVSGAFDPLNLWVALVLQPIPFGIIATAMRIYRDDQLGSGPVLVYTGPPTSTWTDHFPALNVSYKYTVQVDSANGGTGGMEFLTYEIVTTQNPGNGVAYYYYITTPPSSSGNNQNALISDTNAVNYGNVMQVIDKMTSSTTFPNPNIYHVVYDTTKSGLAACMIPVVGNTTYNWSFSISKHLLFTGSEVQFQSYIDWYDSFGNLISTTTPTAFPAFGNTLTTDTWYRSVTTDVAPINAVYAVCSFTPVWDYPRNGSDYRVALPSFSEKVVK